MSQGAEEGVFGGFWDDLECGVLLGCVVLIEENLIGSEKECLEELKKEEGEEQQWVLCHGNSESLEVVKAIL